MEMAEKELLKDIPVKGKEISAILNAPKCATFALLSYIPTQSIHTALIEKY